ncbi:MAG: hypothetical protein K8I03_16400 [Ignavibacteria bacterium]|nr:hypothetical protein [Ignavibacteria bacterium]
MKYTIISIILLISVSHIYSQNNAIINNRYSVRFIIGGMDTTINFDNTSQKIEFDFKIIETIYRKSEKNKMSGDKFSFKVGIFIPDSLAGILFNPFIKISAYNKGKELLPKDSCNHYFTFYKNRNENFINSFTGSLFWYDNDKRFLGAKILYDEDYEYKKSSNYKLSFILYKDSVRTPSYLRNNHDIFSSEIDEYNKATDWINQLIQISSEKEIKENEKEERIQRILSGEIQPKVTVNLIIRQYFKANTLSHNTYNDEYFFSESSTALIEKEIVYTHFPINETFEFKTQGSVISVGTTYTTVGMKMYFEVRWEGLAFPLITSFDIKDTDIKDTKIINMDGSKYDGVHTNSGLISLDFSKKYKIEFSISN